MQGFPSTNARFFNKIPANTHPLDRNTRVDYRLHMSTEHLLIYCTCPDSETGQQLASQLVEQQLAACVNLLPSLSSTYRWENTVTTEQECLLLIKTTTARLSAVSDYLSQAHPYDVPEIIATPIVGGEPDYLNWITDSVE